MPKKIIVSSLLFLLIIPIYFQITRANAEHDPLTPPITSETTPTNTPTMTPTNTPTVTPSLTTTPSVTPTPTEESEEDGTIFGTVIYRNIGIRTGSTPRTEPADGVEVVVETFFGNDEVGSDTTDADGKYAVDVPPGFYKVTVEGDTALFVPPLRVANVHEDQDKQANFQGLVVNSF